MGFISIRKPPGLGEYVFRTCCESASKILQIQVFVKVMISLNPGSHMCIASIWEGDKLINPIEGGFKFAHYKDSYIVSYDQFIPNILSLEHGHPTRELNTPLHPASERQLKKIGMVLRVDSALRGHVFRFQFLFFFYHGKREDLDWNHHPVIFPVFILL